MSVRCHQ